MTTRYPTYLFLWLPLFILGAQPLLGQGTQLNPGDIWVISVSTNSSPCTGNPNGGEDLITFISFQDILPGTVIDFTDNGWERDNPGLWGNTEGFVRMVRTGGVIPAGTPIRIQLPTQIGGGYAATLPDADWNIFELSAGNPFPANLNGTTGDQIYFLQGGNFVEGTVNNHDADYIGGTILSAFNIKSEWLPGQNTPEDSGQHPDLNNCNRLRSPGPIWTHVAYFGDLGPATQLQWSQRLREPSNWSLVPDCAAVPNYSDFEILPSGIDLTCSNCSGCPPFLAQLFFELPQTGIYSATYTNGVDTFTNSGLVDGSFQPIPLDTTTTFTLLQVATAGCPVQSDLGTPVTFTVGPPALPFNSLTIDTCILFPAAFNLLSLEDTLTGGEFLPVAWYEDDQLTQLVANPGAFPLAVYDTLYASVGNPGCPAPPVSVFLNANAQPVVNPVTLSFCTLPGDPTVVDLDSVVNNISPGLEGQLTLFNTGDVGGTPLPNPFSFTGPSFEGEVIAVSDSGCTAGPDTITFQSIPAPDPNDFSLSINSSNLGCAPVDLRLDLDAPAPDLYQFAISINDSLVIQQVFAPATISLALNESADLALISVTTTNGCSASYLPDPDTLTVDVLPGVFLGPNQNLVSCENNPVDLSNGVQLLPPVDTSTQIRFHSAFPPTPANELASPIVQIDRDSQFYAVGVNSSGCADTLVLPVTLDANPIQLDLDPLDVFNGFTVSCAGGDNGSISINISGGTPPYRVDWNNGDTTQTITGLMEGTYAVTVTDDSGCSRVDSVEALAPAPIGAVYVIPAQACDPNSGTDLLLDSLSGGVGPFSWSLNGVSFASVGPIPFPLVAIPPGQQQIFLRDDNGCERIDTIEVPDPGNELILEVPDEFTIFNGESVSIEPQVNFSPVAVSWTPADGISDPTSLNVTASPTTTTTYTLGVQSQEGCILSREVLIRVVQPRRVYVPSAFSPNADGANDRFLPFTEEGNSVLRFEVYDRWGERVFQVENLPQLDASQGWDGTFRGKPMPPGIYIYVVEIQYPDDSTELRRGEVTLMR